MIKETDCGLIMTQSEAKLKYLRVYNNGKMCKNEHNPTIRLTNTGRCMQCEEIRTASRTNKHNFYFQIKLPDGNKQLYGPYGSYAVCRDAFLRKFKTINGHDYPHVI